MIISSQINIVDIKARIIIAFFIHSLFVAPLSTLSVVPVLHLSAGLGDVLLLLLGEPRLVLLLPGLSLEEGHLLPVSCGHDLVFVGIPCLVKSLPGILE